MATIHIIITQNHDLYKYNSIIYSFNKYIYIQYCTSINFNIS